MRDALFFYLNGRPCAVEGDAAFVSLAEFLRESQRLTGTKIGCAEGDCGACTVLIGRVVGRGSEAAIRYQSATSCIAYLHQVDGAHVVTVEGLAEDETLSAVQRAMVEHHGSQCGFCTPGVVTALTEVFESGAPVDASLRTGLTGNLCRCTGYRSILDAGLDVVRMGYHTLAERFPRRAMVEALSDATSQPLRVASRSSGRLVFRPVTLEGAIAFKAENPEAMIVSGGTELGVLRNKRGLDVNISLSLAAVPGLDRVTREGDVVSVGANVTWAKLEEVASREIPALLELTRQFAAPQIRNVATLVGNVAHHSPVADSAPYLAVMGAELELAGRSGERTVDAYEFFRDTGRARLTSDEIITRVIIPLPAPGEQVRLYKISKRKEMDTSTFRAGVRIAPSGGLIARARLAFSGVGPSVRRLTETEAFLAGQPFDEATFREAGRRARAECEATCRAQGRDARLTLAENILLKFYFDCAGGRREEAGIAG